jgi:hypothetical protein
MTSFADDVAAIQNAKARYCKAVDQLAEDPVSAGREFRAVFLPDVVGDYGYEPLHGVEALSDFLCNAIASNSEWRLHMLHSPLVEVDGDRATGDWTVMVYLKRPGGAVDMLLGRYSDELRRTPDGWRLASIRFRRQG